MDLRVVILFVDLRVQCLSIGVGCRVGVGCVLGVGQFFVHAH